jgi:hypothetical protein
MSRLICLATVAAAVLAIPTAQAVSAPAVSLEVSSFQVRYGDTVQLSGHVSNLQPGVVVGIFARPFTESGFARIATVATGNKGQWALEVKPEIATTYQARTTADESQTLLVGVRPAITLTQLDSGQVRVAVAADRSFARKAVKLQKQEPGGAWTTLAQIHLNAKSRAWVPMSIIPLQQTVLRATMSVNQAGQGYLGGFSKPMTVPARWVSLSTSATELEYGQPLRLSGRVSTRVPGAQLRILARPPSTPEFQPLATLMTGAGGKWSLTTYPKVGTVYEAQFSSTTSRMLGVGVHPTAKVRIISEGRVWTQIGGGRSFAGRTVQMQQLVEGQWHTVAKMKLGKNGIAIFPASRLPGGASTMRIAMSVNQAGTGYLGAFSDSFVYQR